MFREEMRKEIKKRLDEGSLRIAKQDIVFTALRAFPVRMSIRTEGTTLGEVQASGPGRRADAGPDLQAAISAREGAHSPPEAAQASQLQKKRPGQTRDTSAEPSLRGLWQCYAQPGHLPPCATGDVRRSLRTNKAGRRRSSYPAKIVRTKHRELLASQQRVCGARPTNCRLCTFYLPRQHNWSPTAQTAAWPAGKGESSEHCDGPLCEPREGKCGGGIGRVSQAGRYRCTAKECWHFVSTPLPPGRFRFVWRAVGACRSSTKPSPCNALVRASDPHFVNDPRACRTSALVAAIGKGDRKPLSVPGQLLRLGQ